MYSALNAGAIHVSSSGLADLVVKAKTHGFDGVEVSGKEILALGPERALTILNGTRAAAFGLPTRWRDSESEWEHDLVELPGIAEACAAIGITRCATWILPFSDIRDFAHNYEFHVRRLKPAVRILGDYGIGFGLEFIGPATMRADTPHEFIHTSHGMMELAHSLGPNAGLLLDAFHWYTAGESVADLRRLSAKDIILVHVNDAPAGVARTEQIDGRRLLPGESGVIDMPGFLGALREMGYDGPVIVEPFQNSLKDLPNDDARLETVRQSLRNIGI